VNYQLISRKLQLSSTPAGIFSALFAASPYAFWLDSSRHDTERARLSFLGACDGPHSYRIDNFVGGSTTLTRANGETEIIESDIFLLLEKCLGSITVESDRSLPFDF
jgi:para-aminobenzoate synthetase